MLGVLGVIGVIGAMGLMGLMGIGCVQRRANRWFWILRLYEVLAEGPRVLQMAVAVAVALVLMLTHFRVATDPLTVDCHDGPSNLNPDSLGLLCIIHSGHKKLRVLRTQVLCTDQWERVSFGKRCCRCWVKLGWR